MKNKEINILIKDYQKTLIEKDLSHTYKYLIELLASIKSEFSKKYKDQYKAGYISPGYLDYSYFSIYNEKLREKQLRFGIVLNHKKMRFELWLMGQNEEIKNKYIKLLKDIKVENQIKDITKYSIIEIALDENSNFENEKELKENIIKLSKYYIKNLENIIKNIEK